MTQNTPPSFLSRIAIAIGSFFAILGNGRLAADVGRLRGGEAFAADVPAPEPREVRIEVPVEKIVEVRVEVPVEKIVEKVVEKIVEKRVEVPVDRIVEKAVSKPVDVPFDVKIADETAALQLLGLLQREARFVDFVKEDVAGYGDADIGAAARIVHEGCRKVLSEHFTIEPVRAETEGSRVWLPDGFEAASIRLSGRVVGQAPFTGTLNHRGWRVTDTRLPQLTDIKAASIVAQAEVEL